MSLNYTTYVAALQTMAAETPFDVPFATILPDAIAGASSNLLTVVNSTGASPLTATGQFLVITGSLQINNP